MSENRIRTVLLCGGSDSSCAVAARLAEISDLRAVLCEPPLRRSDLVRRRVRRLGWTRVADQLLFQAIAAPLLQRASRARKRTLREHYRLSSTWPMRPRPVPAADGDDVLEAIRESQPEVIVLNGTRILRADFLAQLDVPIVNLHAGITPDYRGVHGGYWALREADPMRCGVTLHRVDSGIDTGGVIAQQRIPLTPEDTFATYPLLQLGEGLRLLEKHLPSIAAGRAGEIVPESRRSHLFVHPELTTWLSGWWLYGVR